MIDFLNQWKYINAIYLSWFSYAAVCILFAIFRGKLRTLSKMQRFAKILNDESYFAKVFNC